MEPTNNRVCAFTYVNEKDLPQGQKLLPCSRCQETFYVSVEAKAEHWPVHGQVCCALHEDAPVLEMIHQGGFESVEEAMDEVVRILQNRLQGRSLLYALQQALQFLKNRPGGTEFDRQTILAHIDVILALCKLSLENTKTIWAIPGFVDYFLSPNVWNPLEANRGRLLDGEVLSAAGAQSDHGRTHAPQLNGLYCEMLTKVVLVMDMSIVVPNTMEGQAARLQACVIRHFFQMWSDRQVSTSWPETFWIKDDLVVTRINFFWRALIYFVMYEWTTPFLEHSLMRPQELVPGLTVKDLLVLLMEDQTLFGYPEQQKLDEGCVCLSDLLYQGSLACSYFTVEDCIELFTIAEKWNPPARHVSPTSWCEGIFPENLALFDFVLYLLTLEETKRVIDLKHSSIAESSLAHAVVDHYYQGLMDETMPLLRDFLEAFNNHQRQLISEDEQPIELPEDVVQHMAEFLFPDFIPMEMLYIHGETVPVE